MKKLISFLAIFWILILPASGLLHATGGQLTTKAIQALDAMFSVTNKPTNFVGVVSCSWTNAQVVALGASLTGDIACLTIPAKTQVKNAYVVITGVGAGTATLTVSLGDAIGGTPFINYVVASSAQAAANTVYGDAVAERGTSLDVEFYNMPSYTATTAVTLHFISTVQNLSSVTGSSGMAVFETVTIP